MKKIVDFCKKFSYSVAESKAYAFAASAAYFMFLSFVPIVMLITMILPLTNLDLSSIAGRYDNFIPPYILSIIQEIFSEQNETSAAIISITAIFTLWVSGKGFWALMNGLNAAYRVKEKRMFLKLRFWGSIYTIVFILLIIFTLVVMVCGQLVANFVSAHFPFLTPVMDFLLQFRFLYGWAILTFVFQVIYTFIPNRKLRLVQQFPGALFSSLGWTGFSYVFSLYVKYSDGFSMYGSLATIVITLFWLYYVMYILIIGGIINYFFVDFIEAINRKKLEQSGDEK